PCAECAAGPDDRRHAGQQYHSAIDAVIRQLMAADRPCRKKAQTVPHEIGERPIISRHDIIQPEDCMASDLTDTDYAALAEFRFALRRFQMFSETKAGEAGLTPQQHQALLAIRAADPDSATVGYVAQRLLVKPHTASGLIDR